MRTNFLQISVSQLKTEGFSLEKNYLHEYEHKVYNETIANFKPCIPM